jgi:hypothetical protein
VAWDSYPQPQYLTVDLGQTRTIRAFDLHWQAEYSGQTFYPGSFRLLATCDDGTSFFPVWDKTTTSYSDACTYHSLPRVSSRYWLLECSDPPASSGKYGVTTLSLYGE